jgi:release factor glutamine methyltransferase
MKAQALIGPAVAALRRAGVDSPETDARRLLAFAMNLAPDRLTLHLNDAVDTFAIARFTLAMDERLARRPVAQITGQRQFWGRSFQVSDAVLDPRPETETLVAEALRGSFTRVLDLGTGSGCILLSLLAERSMATGVGVDISLSALDVARGNAAALGLAGRAAFVNADWFGGLYGRFDLIVSNPPYIAEAEMADLAPEVRDYEPRIALTPGGDGLGAYRSIAAGALAYLSAGGRILLEIGPTQEREVAGLLAAQGLVDICILPDLDGRDRVVAARAAG